MTKICYDKDADLQLLKNRRIGIIGYGNQGRAQAMNMRDSGITNITISTAKDATFDQALGDGFQVMDIPEVVDSSDILFLLIPDEIMPHLQMFILDWTSEYADDKQCYFSQAGRSRSDWYTNLRIKHSRL